MNWRSGKLRSAAVGRMAAFQNHRVTAVGRECEIGNVRFGGLPFKKLGLAERPLSGNRVGRFEHGVRIRRKGKLPFASVQGWTAGKRLIAV